MDGLAAHGGNAGSGGSSGWRVALLGVLEVVVGLDVSLLPDDVVKHPFLARSVFGVRPHLAGGGVTAETKVIGATVATEEQRRSGPTAGESRLAHRVNTPPHRINATDELPAAPNETGSAQAQAAGHTIW